MKHMVITLFLVLIAYGCGANQSPENLLMQSRIYTDSYYRYFDLNSRTNHDLFFLQTGTKTSQTKLYLYNLKEKKIDALHSVGKPIKEQFLDILKTSPKLMFNEAASLIEVNKLEFDSTNCAKAFELLDKISLPFKAETKVPLSIKLGSPSYTVQQRRGKGGLIIETISTSTSSIGVINELLAVQGKLEECDKN